MMNYYPDHVYFQSPSPFTSTIPPVRRCSVKGCGKDLSPDYALKMCEACRGRHRKYATTKRAKRKQEKAAVGAQRINHDDGRVVTWMPQDHLVHVSLGPIPDDTDPVPNMHVNQIDPRLFNPTSSELAGALTLPPLDSSSDLQDAYIPTQTQVDAVVTSPSAGRSTGQSRYCSVKGCRTVIGGDYLFKMCVPCRNRYRGYGMTKRSKSKRGREVAAQELQRMRGEEDVRRAQQGLPLIGELQASDRRAWERKVLESIPRPPVVQYAPISLLPVRMCTVSHCHTILQGHYPYRRCERHRLQNRHHSKLKRVRDKEVKSTPLRSEGTEDPELFDSGSRKGKARAVDSPYTNEPLSLDTFALEIDGAEVSEYEDIPDESSIPPPARGARRSNTVCSVKWCQNVLYHRSPWKMCETHREKDRMNRRRKSGRDQSIPGDLDEELPGQVGEHSAVAVDMGPDGEAADLMLDSPASAAEPSVIFMEPLIPPEETLPTTMLQQPELPDFPGILPDVDPLLSYGSGLPEGILTGITAGPDVPGEVDIEISSQQSVTEGSSAEEHCVDGQEVSNLHQQDISSMVWGDAVSPVSTSGSDSMPSQPASSSSSTTTIMATSGPAPFPGTSSSASHIQPQFQVPYYMPPPFPIPYTHGQPPFLVSGPYPPMSYAPRPPYTYSAPVAGPFQAFQYAPPPGQLGPFALRPYPYTPWGPYASGAAEANWIDASPQAQIPMQTQGHTQGKSQRKRGRAGGPGEDGLRIVMVQPKGALSEDVAVSATSSTSLVSTSGPARTASDPGLSPPSSSATDSLCDEVSSATGPITPADSGEQVATRLCSSEACRRRLPNGASGTLCERCKTRLKRRQEKRKLRLRLEPRKPRLPSRRLET